MQNASVLIFVDRSLFDAKDRQFSIHRKTDVRCHKFFLTRIPARPVQVAGWRASS